MRPLIYIIVFAYCMFAVVASCSTKAYKYSGKYNKNPKMSRYNHFSKTTYATICFSSLNDGDKFRMDKFDGKRRRKDIIMIKLSDRSYKEFKSGKEYKVFTSVLDVYSFDLLNQAS